MINTDEIKEEIVHNVESGKTYTFEFLKWLLFAAILGVICGFAGTFFYKSIEFVTDIRINHEIIIFFLPLAGLAIIGIYHLFGVKHDAGTNLVLDSIHSHKQIPGTMAPLIYIGTVITHLFGGSSGREGAAIQMGGCIGVSLGKRFNMTEKDINVLTMCGMSAVFAAMFGTPITATIFSMEVISVGVFHYSAFVPCIIAATFSYSIANFFGVLGESFSITTIPAVGFTTCIQTIALSVLCGLVAIIFCQSVHLTQKLYRRFFKNQYIRIFVGGTIVVAVTLITGTRDYNGAGFNLIETAFHSEINWYTFIIKLILTALTLGSGFKGGEIVPALCVGATFGNVLSPILGLEPTFGTALGMICMFCGVVNCPIASILLAIEMFGRHDLVLFCIAIGVSYVFSGCFGLYKSQKILYSKLHAEYINIHSH